ncbi:MAG: DUF459 domain-containing protein, partial [Acidimicrobiia bacterium]
KMAERLTERPGLPHHENWSEGTEVEPPRRQMAAGHVLVVGLIALLFGAFLNAPGLLDTAKSQPLNSFRRDVSLFFARPLDDVSGFLQISRPHDWLEEGLGLRDAGRSTRALPTPTTTSPGAPSTTKPPLRNVNESRPLRLWCGGDSLAKIPCDSLINVATGTGFIASVAATDSQVATGLARTEVYNWPAHLAEVTAGTDPDVAVIMFGANDDQGLTDPNGNFTNTFGTPEWTAEYSNRAGGLMDQIIGEGRTVVLVGVPPINNEERNLEYRAINQIYRKEAAKRPGRAIFVDTYAKFSNLDGTYTDFVACNGGEAVPVRAPDQIHFNTTGGDCLAAEILAKIKELWQIGPNGTNRDTGNGGK